MSGRRVLPPVDELLHMANTQKLTYDEIVQRVFEETGEKVSRQAVSAQIRRAGKGRDVVRHNDVLPWRVRFEHQKHYFARMLRLEGRRLKGMPLSDADLQRLERFKADLDHANAVIDYDPTDTEGFVARRRRPGLDDGGLIRRTDQQLRDMGLI